MHKLSSIPKREDIKGYDALEELALDFFWSWNRNHLARKVWQELDMDLWEQLKNPWAILQAVSREKLESKLADPNFQKLINDLFDTHQKESQNPTWFQKNHTPSVLNCIAYFSMEYMLGESLPIYSGGLGNVAGDQLKAASDLGVPVIAIGLLYQQGYFRQMIDKDGNQHAIYPYNDPGQLPIMPLRKSNGEWLRLEIALPGWSVWLRAWEVKVGRVKLYLLDSNDTVNLPALRGITSELYGGDSELRLKQELILGIGGWRLLTELGIKPDVCHLNEGHAAFAILERAKCFMKENGASFEEALTATRAGNLFTTHTAVPAGFDRFSPYLIEQYLGKYAKNNLGLSINDLLALGRQNASDNAEHFNMAYLAIRGSGAVNGVSRLHGKVSRKIFENLFPRWPTEEVPIGHVTNGVHMPSWSSVKAGEMWTASCGKACWLAMDENTEKNIKNISDGDLWKLRNHGRASMIDYARKRLAGMWAARGFSEEDVARARQIFDPNTLTLGFARRFATYKRPNMLLHDKERLLRILSNPQRPVQLIISGKAHPADRPGQDMIREWIQLFFQRQEARTHIIFLSDYDMAVTQNLVTGVDLWINTPRRPWEACGTSGMKVLANGGINLSELDGWWAEAYRPEVGWALGDVQEHGEDPAWDAREAVALYEILENQVIPEFYNRDKEGIPTAWIARIKESMSTLTPRFSADRAVRDYTEKYYLPAADNYHKRANDKGSLAKQIVGWEHTLNENWHALRFGEMKVETTQDNHQFEIQVYLNNLDPKIVQVELFAAGQGDEAPFRQEMTQVRPLPGTSGMYLYSISIPKKRPANDFVPRLIPRFAGAAIPLEAPQILWQH